MTLILTILYCISFISLLYTTIHQDYKKHRIYTKSLTSFLFILLYLSAVDKIHIPMLSAVILCFLGDFFLALQKDNKKTHMIHGIIAFLCAHFMYITVMLSYSSFQYKNIILPIFGVLLLSIITSQLKIDLGNKKYMIYFYTFLIFLMNSKAIDILITKSNAFGYLLGIGATLFVLSDMLLLFLYFKYKNNLQLQISNSIIYYLAQYLMVISFMFI